MKLEIRVLSAIGLLIGFSFPIGCGKPAPEIPGGWHKVKDGYAYAISNGHICGMVKKTSEGLFDIDYRYPLNVRDSPDTHTSGGIYLIAGSAWGDVYTQERYATEDSAKAAVEKHCASVKD